ncbi:MAG: archaetidylserine decarboxylase, partial [Myxococcota bacterium]
PGVRPIDPAPEALVSPCDGFWGASGRVEEGELLQVKGRPYSLAALLGDAEQARRLEGGAFATFYLSPRDYHRFHMPCDATPVAARHLPGTLLPVNGLGLHGVDGLFAGNERIAASFVLPGGGELAIVAVGATNVGKVRVTFDDLTTQTGRGPEARRYVDARPLAKGEEWGRFEFGSTLVLVAAAEALRLEPEEPDRVLRLGTRIGTLL